MNEREVRVPALTLHHEGGIEKIQLAAFQRDGHVVVGPAYGEKKFNLISESICVAFPSRHDELSLWSLEALASGMPMIMFDLPEARWVSESASLKAKPFNLNEYSELLVMATEKKLNLKMRRAARDLASKYDWESVAKDFENYFYEIIKIEKN